ncbi:hypothetical protein P5673_025689 [Acropora cervicornis]|uniref:THAP-type domain-containing protein n=1 Tax=Acropora cervicornis TaxID=6130 RepID=A0AAD9UX51_ACRCE|nr:hypothetical protein P5673_025689 [Acropora cervicornis]
MDGILSNKDNPKTTPKSREKYCAAVDCKNSCYDSHGHRTKYHFFRFPKKIKQRNRWCNLIKRQHGKDGFSVNSSTVVCSEHFEKEDIIRKLGGRWDLKKGAEPSQFNWTREKPIRKPPKDRIHPESMGADKSATSDLVSILCDHFTDTFPGDPQNPTSDLVSISCDDLTDTSPGDPQTEANVIHEMQAKIATLESKLSICQEKLREEDEEIEILLRQQFSIDKVKHDNSAIMFYTGFPSYEVLISFFHYIEPKISKMQYWKGEILLKESQSYKTDENRMKPGPSRKLNSLDEFFLVLMRLKAGLFVQDLSDRFGISITTVSRI